MSKVLIIQRSSLKCMSIYKERRSDLTPSNSIGEECGWHLKEWAYGFSEICKMVDEKNVFVSQKQISLEGLYCLLFCKLLVGQISKRVLRGKEWWTILTL